MGRGVEQIEIDTLCGRISAVEKELAELKEYLNIGQEEKVLERGTVYSAVPLGEETLARLERQMEELIKKPVSLKNKINKELIGGFLISVDGKLVDASLKKQMEDLTLRLTADVKGGEPQ